VTKVECGIAEVGGEYLNKKAQGQFCLVHVTVKNIGNEARTFTSGNQSAYNAAGQKYEADSAAGISSRMTAEPSSRTSNPVTRSMA
jgi:Domain of unknown function (DUF4352)